MTHRAKRAAAVVVAGALLALPLLGPPPATAQLGADEAIVGGAALAASAVAVTAVNPDFDFWPVYSSSSIENDGSHGLSGAIWPGFLVDAFFWLYGFQPLERAALGISETQWPNPPHAASGSSSRFVMNNFSQGCQFVFGDEGAATEACKQLVDPILNDPPGAVGVSRSQSGRLTSDGGAHATRFAYPGIMEAGEVVADTSTVFEDGQTISTAVLTAHDVAIGVGLHLEQVRATSTSIATADGTTASATSGLTVVGATWNGQDAVIDDQGVHLTADRSTDGINDQLAAQGLEVRLMQGRERASEDGQFVDTATGGLLVRVARDRAEEAFPMPVQQVREAACTAAAQSPLNEEITRVRVSEPNPLFGVVPFVPMPERAEVEQSVPPPFSCPFVNRSFEVSLVLGYTNASSRLSPLPTFEFDGAPVAAPDGTGGGPSVESFAVTEPFGPTQRGVGDLRPPANDISAPTLTDEPARLARAVGPTEADVAAGVKAMYLAVMAIVGLAVGGRTFLRAISAP